MFARLRELSFFLLVFPSASIMQAICLHTRVVFLLVCGCWPWLPADKAASLGRSRVRLLRLQRASGFNCLALYGGVTPVLNFWALSWFALSA